MVQNGFFYKYADRLQFAVNLREYIGFSLDHLRSSISSEIRWGMFVVAIFAFLGCIVPSRRIVASTKQSVFAWLPLMQMVIMACMVVHNVAFFTRWRDYQWHDIQSSFFSNIRLFGGLAERALPIVQVFRLLRFCTATDKQDVFDKLWTFLRWLIWRLCEVAFLGAFWI